MRPGSATIASAVLAALLLASMISCEDETGDDDSDDRPADDDGDDNDAVPWYERVVFMEIFVRSFQDTNGDGIGDISGITQRLPYIADLGIGGLWLTPIHPSPFVDSGYDVADYFSINPDYGTIEDFQLFLDRAHQFGMRVFMDGVFNHTSDQHPWFVESRSSRDNPKRDWYIWADEPLFPCEDPFQTIPFPELWTLDPTTGQYYFHHFRPQQPDLNFANPEVREAIFNVARFWLDMGVDGFRLDTAHLYYEDASACLHHPKTHEVLKELRGVLDEYDDRALIGEVAGFPGDVVPYLGDGSDELHMIFNFPLTYGMIAALILGNPLPAQAMLDMTWASFPEGGWQGVAISNHDFYRYHGFLGLDDDMTKLASTLQLTLPGTAFIYYGEEVGMANGDRVVVDYRDAARTPMHWDATENAGFTDGEPWIALAHNHWDHNVQVEYADPGSLLNHFRRLIRIRNGNAALNSGRFDALWTGDFRCYAYFRGEGAEAVLVVLNMSDETAGLNLDLGKTQWNGLAGRVIDLYTGMEYMPLLPENAGAYPLALPPRGFALLSLSK